MPLLHFRDAESALNFVCGICSKVVNPFVAIEHVDCGRVFCRSCLNVWFRCHSVCPQCGRTATGRIREVVTENKMVFNFIINLHVFCPSTLGPDGIRGCPWVGPWGSLAEHLKSCEELTVPCKFACGYVASRKLMMFHESSVCALRPVLCDYCTEKFPRKDLGEHMMQCKQNFCKVLPCKHADIGCVFVGSKAERARHEEHEDRLHLELALAYIKRMESREVFKKPEPRKALPPPMPSMSIEEKLELKRKLACVRSKDVDDLIKILKGAGSMGANKEMLEFNLETLPDKTCRELQRFVAERDSTVVHLQKRIAPEPEPTRGRSPVRVVSFENE